MVKVIASFGVLAYQLGLGQAAALTWQGLFVNWRDTLLVGLPAILYLVQNNPLYVATRTSTQLPSHGCGRILTT